MRSTSITGAPSRKVRHAGHAQLVADARVHHLALEVGDADARGARIVGDRQRQAVALEGIDRDADPQRLHQVRRIGAQSKDVVVGLEHADAGLDTHQLSAPGQQPADLGPQVDRDRVGTGGHEARELVAELVGVAHLFARRVDRARDAGDMSASAGSISTHSAGFSARCSAPEGALVLHEAHGRLERLLLRVATTSLPFWT
jgi:hypothetical protein